MTASRCVCGCPKAAHRKVALLTASVPRVAFAGRYKVTDHHFPCRDCGACGDYLADDYS